MTHGASIYFASPLVRASDADREDSMCQLRGHWMAGRLTLDEYEERCDEAARARYVADLTAVGRELPAAPAPAPPGVLAAPPAPQSTGGGALVLGILGLVVFVLSFGWFFFIALPMSLTAIVLGHIGRRRARGDPAPMAVAGEVLGIVGTVLGSLPILLLIVM